MSCPFPKSKNTTLIDDQFQNDAKAPDVNSYSSRGPCGKGGFCFAEKQFVLCPAASPLLRSPGS